LAHFGIYFYFVRDIKPPNCFHEFFSVLAVEKENRLFKGPKLRKIRGKNWGKQDWLFGGLIWWNCHNLS
jgi:hypothetical protein